MKLLVKLGGTLLDAPASRAALAAQIAAAAAVNPSMVVVHGGGKQMTRFLEERGVKSEFVGGLRVTSPEIIDAVLKVFAGSVNKDLVCALQAAGARAAGLTGIDGGLAVASQMNPDLGAVGRIDRTDPSILEALTGAGFLPVVACVAGNGRGEVYNVNADQMAVACAAGFAATRLLFLTDVEGVRGADGAILPFLTPADCDRLIADGVATGGMQAKLQAACDALRRGVGEVVIAPGVAPEVLSRLLAGETLGTRVIPEAPQ